MGEMSEQQKGRVKVKINIVKGTEVEGYPDEYWGYPVEWEGIAFVAHQKPCGFWYVTEPETGNCIYPRAHHQDPNALYIDDAVDGAIKRLDHHGKERVLERIEKYRRT